MSDVTVIRGRMQGGDTEAAQDLLPLIYDQLRQRASARMSREKPGNTLQGPALVHDVRLCDFTRHLSVLSSPCDHAGHQTEHAAQSHCAGFRNGPIGSGEATGVPGERKEIEIPRRRPEVIRLCAQHRTVDVLEVGGPSINGAAGWTVEVKVGPRVEDRHRQRQWVRSHEVGQGERLDAERKRNRQICQATQQVTAIR